MRIRESFDFESDVASVLALFTDRDYFVEKYRRLGATDIEITDCHDDGGVFEITVSRAEPQVLPLPGFLRRITGERIRITQTDRWYRDDARGEIEIHLVALPVRVHAGLALEPMSLGSRLYLELDIDADVPVLGKRVAKFLAADAMPRMRRDIEESRSMLQEDVA